MSNVLPMIWRNCLYIYLYSCIHIHVCVYIDTNILYVYMCTLLCICNKLHVHTMTRIIPFLTTGHKHCHSTTIPGIVQSTTLVSVVENSYHSISMSGVNDCWVSSKIDLHSDYLELKSRHQWHGRPFVCSDDSIVVVNVKEEARVGQKTSRLTMHQCPASTQSTMMVWTVARYALEPFMGGAVVARP